jgi:hypothetical protein
VNRSIFLKLALSTAAISLTACSGGPRFENGGEKTATLSSDSSQNPLPAGGSPLSPSDSCSPPGGVARSTASITGEDWPGNTVDKKGADNNDYTLSFSGGFMLDAIKKTIGTSGPAELRVNYSRGQSKCGHKFTFQFRRCPNKDSSVIGSVEMNAGQLDAKSQTISIPAPAYLDIKITTTSPEGGIKVTNLYESLGSFFTFK